MNGPPDLCDLDVPMHYNHERAKTGVTASVSRARISDQLPAVVEIGGFTPAGLVRPEVVATFPIPVKIPTRPYNQRYQMTFPGAPVVGQWLVDQFIGNRPGLDFGARNRGVLGSSRFTGLGVGIGPVIATIVIAVVVVLDLTGVVPPTGLVERRTPTSATKRPSGFFPQRPFGTHLVESVDLPFQSEVKRFTEAKFADRSGTSTDEILKSRVFNVVRQTKPKGVAVRYPEQFGQSLGRPAGLFHDQTAITQGRSRRHSQLASFDPLRWLKTLQGVRGIAALQFNDRVLPAAENIDSNSKCHITHFPSYA